MNPLGGPGRAPLRGFPLALLPAALALIVGLPALGGSWVWDDSLVLQKQLRAFRTLGDLLVPPRGIAGFSVHYYRPLTIGSWILDRKVWGERPWGFHLTVLIAHALVAGLVYLLIRSFLGQNRSADLAALFGALLFAVHPIHTESIAWIAGRSDVLAGLGIVASALFLRRRPLTVPAVAGGLACFGLACLAKEVAFGLLPLVPILVSDAAGESTAAGEDRDALGTGGGIARQGRAQFEDGRPNRGTIPGGVLGGPRRRVARAVLVFASFTIVAAGVLALRGAALGGLGSDAPRAAERAESIKACGGAFFFYLTRAILPLPPAPFVDRIPAGAEAWIGLTAGIVLALAALALVRRSPAVGAGLSWFIVLLVPSLLPAVLRVSTVPLAERYLYVPSVGIAVAAGGALAVLFGHRPRWRSPLSAVLSVVVVSLGVVDLHRAGIWKDDLSLWAAASRQSSSAAPRIYYGTALVAAGRLDEALGIYGEILSDSSGADPSQRALATMNRGVIRRARGESREALHDFEETVRLDPGSGLGWFNLAASLWDAAWIDPAGGNADASTLARSRESIERAAALSPFDPDVWLLYGRILGAVHEREGARRALDRAAGLDPEGRAGAEARRLLALLG